MFTLRFTVNEFGLEVHTPQGKVTAVWDDVQSAELSQGVMLVEIRRGGGSSNDLCPVRGNSQCRTISAVLSGSRPGWCGDCVGWVHTREVLHSQLP